MPFVLAEGSLSEGSVFIIWVLIDSTADLPEKGTEASQLLAGKADGNSAPLLPTTAQRTYPCISVRLGRVQTLLRWGGRDTA